MRHAKVGRKLGRNSSHRKALYRNMADSLIIHGRIKTTLAKAKELRSYAEKLITLSKEDTLAAKKAAIPQIRTKEAFKILFSDLNKRFASRKGGYTRIIKVGALRKGDAAPMAYIELVDYSDLKAKELAAQQEKSKAEKPAKKAKKTEEKKD